MCLPYADSSFAVKTLQQTKTLTYCFNTRAANYPNFKAQVASVDANHEAALGIDWVELGGTYETSTAAKAAGCQVLHSMPDVHGCGECGAWVHYLNNPVLIEYRWQAGYTDWRTTIAHEQTHIYGLHEHYDDINFRSFRVNYGYWAHGYNLDPGTSTDSPTVMDSSVGGYLFFDWFTDYDLKHVCMNMDPTGIFFTGCGLQVVQEYPFWNGTRWVFEDGWTFQPDSGCGQWFSPANQLIWGACDPSWGGRYFVPDANWTDGSSTLDLDTGLWFSGGLRLP